MSSLSSSEAEIYDRQLRVWGIDCQQSITASRILCCSLNGSTIEMLKNLILAGVGQISIWDSHTTIAPELFANNYCLSMPGNEIPKQPNTESSNKSVKKDQNETLSHSSSSSSKNQPPASYTDSCIQYLQELNPHVKFQNLSATYHTLEGLFTLSLIQTFDCIIVSDLDLELLVSWYLCFSVDFYWPFPHFISGLHFE